MKIFQKEITLNPYRRGFHLISHEIVNSFNEIKEIEAGLLHVFIKHTSASLTLNENADPNIETDTLKALDKAIPLHNGYLHDQIDNNAAAHINTAPAPPAV